MAANTGTQRTVPEKKFSGAKVHKVSNVLNNIALPHTLLLTPLFQQLPHSIGALI
jgi:hypothetical protein